MVGWLAWWLALLWLSQMPDVCILLGLLCLVLPFSWLLVGWYCGPTSWHQPSQPEGLAVLPSEVPQGIATKVLGLLDPWVLTVGVGLTFIQPVLHGLWALPTPWA